MSKYSLKELYGPGGTFYSGRHLGTSGADSYFSSYIANKKAYPPQEDVDLEETEEEGEEMSDDLLERRVLDRSGMYRLTDSLSSINEFLDTAASVAKGGVRAAGLFFKSAALAIPFVDVLAGSMYLTSGVAKFKSVTDEVIRLLDVPENTFVQALTSQSEQHWQEIISLIEQLPQDQREELKEKFEDMLSNMKSLILTIAQSYDSIVALAAGPGAPVAEAGANLSTAFVGFVAELIPFERFLFEVSTKYAEDVDKVFTMLDEVEHEKITKLKQDGGSVFVAIITTPPSRTFKRLGDFYTAVSGEYVEADPKSFVSNQQTPGNITDKINLEDMPTPEEFQRHLAAVFGDQSISESLKRKSLFSLLENLDEDIDEESEEEVKEMSAGGVPGVAVPLGHNPDATPTTYAQLKKLRKKQDVYQITENQDWNHKTLGRIKFK